MKKKPGIVAALIFLLVAANGCEALNIRVLMNEGHRKYKAKEYNAAIEVYKKVLAKEPDHWDANYYIAVSHLALYHPGSTHVKDIEAADGSIKFLEKLLTFKPPSEEKLQNVRRYYISLLIAADKSDKAIAYLEEELRKAPNEAGNLSQLAQLYAKKGDFPNALKYFEKIAQLKNDAASWYTVAYVCWERSFRGKDVTDAERRPLVDKGLAAADKAISMQADYFDALINKNLLLREKAKVAGNAGDALAAYELTKQADEWQRKALDARKRNMEKAKANEAPAAGTAAGQ